MKELEKLTSAHITSLEREKAVIEEKLTNVEWKLHEDVRSKDKENVDLKEKLDALTTKYQGTLQLLEEENWN